MYILEYYKQLREDCIKVQNHVFSCYQDIYMIPTLHTFRVLKDNIIAIEEDEEHFLMDFAVYGHRAGGKTAMERYVEEYYDQITPRMQEFTQVALKNSLLFAKVEHVDEKDGTIQLTGLLGNQKDKAYCISDWGFSQNAVPNLLIFARIISFPDSFEERDYFGNIGMTSGILYIFYGKDQRRITKEAKQLAHKYKAITDLEVRKQVIFFYLNRAFGISKTFV